MGKNIILTGDRPTGRLHLGHYVGSLKRRVELQNSGEYHEINILIADDQALTDNADDPGKIRDNIINVVLDYLSAGLDPEKTTICVQSALPALHALTFYYMNLVTTARLSRNPTVKAEIQMRGFADEGLHVLVFDGIQIIFEFEDHFLFGDRGVGDEQRPIYAFLGNGGSFINLQLKLVFIGKHIPLDHDEVPFGENLLIMRTDFPFFAFDITAGVLKRHGKIAFSGVANAAFAVGDEEDFPLNPSAVFQI